MQSSFSSTIREAARRWARRVRMGGIGLEPVTPQLVAAEPIRRRTEFESPTTFGRTTVER